MAMGSFFAAAPAVAAAVGFYFIDRNFVKVRKVVSCLMHVLFYISNSALNNIGVCRGKKKPYTVSYS